MSTNSIPLNEKKLEAIFERVVQRVLASRTYDVSLTKELEWLQAGEAALKTKKRYKDPKKLVADLLK